jgi:hypothetical protein
MKVTRKETPPVFIPVTITLESQEEVDYLCSLVGNVHGAGKVRQFVDNVYSELKVHAEGRDLFTNTIGCKHL